MLLAVRPVPIDEDEMPTPLVVPPHPEESLHAGMRPQPLPRVELVDVERARKELLLVAESRWRLPHRLTRSRRRPPRFVRAVTKAAEQIELRIAGLRHRCGCETGSMETV